MLLIWAYLQQTSRESGEKSRRSRRQRINRLRRHRHFSLFSLIFYLEKPSKHIREKRREKSEKIRVPKRKATLPAAFLFGAADRTLNTISRSDTADFYSCSIVVPSMQFYFHFLLYYALCAFPHPQLTTVSQTVTHTKTKWPTGGHFVLVPLTGLEPVRF